MRLALLVSASALATLVGCGDAEQVKQQAADAVSDLEAQTAKMFAAFDGGDPKGADGPLHKIDAPFKALMGLESKLGLDAEGVAALKEAQLQVLAAFKELHEPMHESVFPDDFDFSPIRTKLIEAFAALRAAMPAEIAAQLPTSPLTAAPASEVADEAELAEASDAAP